MKILHFTDLHSNLDGIDNIATEIKEAELIILSGDITHFGNKEDARKIVEAFSEINENIVAVSGNCDHKDVVNYLEDKGINIEEKNILFNGFNIIGLGGSLFTPFNTPNEYNEDYYQDILEKIGTLKSANPTIIVSHQPPFNTILDKMMAVMHVGSKSLRKVIEKDEPLICVCGHIHESTGIDKIGKTQIVNPGPWRDKKYASIEINDKSVDIEILKA